MAQPERTEQNICAECIPSRYPVGIPTEIELRIHLNRKTRDADFEILIPPGAAMQREDVFVSVDGREPEPLALLQEPNVGRGDIRHNLNDSHILFLRDVVLQGEDGGNVRLFIRNVRFEKPGSYVVKVLVDVLYGGTHKVFQQSLVLSCEAAEQG